ncbi:hypothetical protein BGP_3409 [Beggiatoa sp. PS]|nr:hypothetical protein BGP_3409 [Beggiatoa sp. PS]
MESKALALAIGVQNLFWLPRILESQILVLDIIKELLFSFEIKFQDCTFSD